MGNRKQPFGYKMLMGGVVIHPREAQAVQEIFQRYLSGASFGDITDHLKEKGPPYDADKPWNKNMVARILEDNRYAGTERFPAILSAEQLQEAAQRRSERKPAVQITEAQKTLRRLCNGRPSKAVTEQVLTLLNRLAAQPQQIVPQPQSVDRSRLAETVRRFADKLAESPVNEEQARSLAVELAGSSYESIGGSEYETYRLRRLFTASGPMVEISAALLRETVSQICIKKGRAGLLLKNGQMIEESLDEYAADIVRDIFSWKLEGMSPQDIAARLNRNGVLSPMEYKKSLGMKFATSFKANSQALWSANAVIRILKNPVYTGVLIQGKETTPSYKVRKRVTKPENEWAVVSDTHEAIIERRDFDSVQKALLLDTRRSPGDSAVQLFSGMVFCGECGASMVRKTVPSGNKKYVYYVCAAHKQDKSCSPHRMRDEALEQLVLDTVKQYIRDVVDLDDILAMTDTAPLRTAEAQKVQRQLDKKRSEYERFQKLLMSLYENLADGIIDRDEYARLKQNYAGRCAECEKQMEALQETITQIKEHGGEHREWMAQFREHLNITELERSIVVALIDRILIYKDNRVEVCFRFADEFAWQTDILRQSQIREVV